MVREPVEPEPPPLKMSAGRNATVTFSSKPSVMPSSGLDAYRLGGGTHRITTGISPASTSRSGGRVTTSLPHRMLSLSEGEELPDIQYETDLPEVYLEDIYIAQATAGQPSSDAGQQITGARQHPDGNASKRTLTTASSERIRANRVTL